MGPKVLPVMIDKQSMNQLFVKKASLCRVGAYCAFIAGLCYSLIVCCAFLSPSSIASYVTSPQYFADFESYRPIFIFFESVSDYCEFSICQCDCGISFIGSPKKLWTMTVFSILGIIGCGVGCFNPCLI